MKILITGAEGFIGSKLCARLLLSEHSIIEHKLIDGNISDPKCFSYLNDTEINHVIHLAALNFVPDSWKFPQKFFDSNVTGMVNILELCKRKNASLTFISSYLYGVPKSLPISEEHPVQIVNPYMFSKKTGEDLCHFYFNNHNINTTILRPFNIYGIGQNENFIIPLIINSAIKNGFIEIRDLEPKRDYLYVEDFVSLLIATIGKENGINVYNAGSGVSYSVKDLIEKVIKQLGVDVPYKSTQKSRVNEIPDVVANINKAKSELNWKPLVSIDEGITEIITNTIQSQNA